MRAATPRKGRQRSAIRSSLAASGRRFRFKATLAASCSARSPAGKASGWPRQNRRKMSAVHGPTPLTATSALWASSASRSARPFEIEAALDDRLGKRAQSADFGVRQSAGAQVLFRRLGDFSRLEGRDARLQSAENGGGAGRRHLLRHDDRGQPRKARLPAAKRRRAADRDQAIDELRVLGAQALGGFAQGRLVVDRGAGMVDPCLRRTTFGAPGCSDRWLTLFASPPWPMKSSRLPPSSASRRRRTGRSISATPIRR